MARGHLRDSLSEIVGEREPEATGEQASDSPQAETATVKNHHVPDSRRQRPNGRQDRLARDHQIRPRDARLSRRLRRRQKLLDRAPELASYGEHRPLIALKQSAVVDLREA